MAKVINISDKFSTEKPKIQIGEEEYEVSDTMETVLQFQELADNNDIDKMKAAIELALGKENTEKLNINAMRVENFRVLTIAIMAAMQGLEYEEVESRFRNAEE